MLFLSYLVLMLISSTRKGTVISQIVNSLNICVTDDLGTELHYFGELLAYTLH